MNSFTVLISIYIEDDINKFRMAFDSVTCRQSVQPTEIIIILDGMVSPDIYNFIARIKEKYPGILYVFSFDSNKGLGIALQKGMELAKNEIVIRMDSDDISAPDRFEKQLLYMEEHPEVAVCGGQITEFIDDPQNIVGKRICPCSDYAIKQYMKKRCAFNHVTVALRRSKVLEAGNYQPWFCNEDYYLWVRMILAGCKFANLSDTLVNVRVGKDMYARRGGWRYFKSEAGIQRYMRQKGLISWQRFCLNVTIRLIVQIVLPNRIRGLIFQKVFRKQ